MHWDEDIDLMAGKKLMPKQGRRAGGSSSPEKTDQLLESALESVNDSPPESLLRGRKTGKWADDGGKLAKNKNSTNLIEQERFQSEKVDSDDEIPVIPDIEEFQDDFTVSNDIEAAKVSAMKSTYRELDTELIKLHTNQKFGLNTDINLSVLTNKLYPEKGVKEVDEEWSMKSLLENVMTIINN